MKGTTLVAALLCLLVASQARSQALTSLASLRTTYNTRKATVRPTGELKAAIDAVDQHMAAATRAGRTGEVRRLLAKGMALMAGRTWTDELDFASSVVVRTPHVIADSTKPYDARLEQIYTPSLELTHSLVAHPRLQIRPAPPAGAAANATPPPPVTVKDFGTLDGVARDLRESPFPFELDVHDIADGTYQLAVDILDEEKLLTTSTLTIHLQKGLDRLAAQLEADAQRAPDDLKADMLFPVDRMRNVNRGRIELRTFAPDRDFATASDIAAAVRTGKNPFAGRTGDFKRHYALKTADEILPYRMYVPTSYNASRAYPLIIALHGLGATEDSFFDSYEKALPPLAEQHGYIVAAPLGYRVDGGYGWGLATPPADVTTRRSQQASEDDVMQVLQIVRQQYKIDPNRIYLLGHSLGAIGTWKIAPKFPDIWAAIAPISGSGNAASLDRLRSVPEIIVHGDDDRTVNVQGSRTMVARLKELGTEFTYIEVPGGSHSGVVAPNLPAVIEFFDRHRKKG